MPERIYDADYPVPTLPTTGMFTYLFPDKPSDSPLRQFPASAPAYICGFTGRTLTRGQLKENALRLATGMRSLGVRKGDVACLWGPNSLEWAQTAYGCMAAGVTVSPANAA
jgi:acyl-CoA synthetase (AMP-forming)/AMP-acid ligase II